MQRKPFDGKVFGQLSDMFSGTEQCDPQKKVMLGKKCVRILDSLGRRPEDFAERTTDTALLEALKAAILATKNVKFKVGSTAQLFHLIREQRNRYYRVTQGTYTSDDSAAITAFGQPLREFGPVAEAA